jgi:hypothetical protein
MKYKSGESFSNSFKSLSRLLTAPSAAPATLSTAFAALLIAEETDLNKLDVRERLTRINSHLLAALLTFIYAYNHLLSPLDDAF